MHAPVGVAADLGRGQTGVPQRDEAQRDEHPARVAAPLLDHPVVVGLDAGEAEVPVVGGLVEGLPAEPGEVRETERSVHPVGFHVLDPSLELEATGPDVVVGDGPQPHLVGLVAHRGDVAPQHVDHIAEQPAVRGRAVGREVVLVLGPGAHDANLGHPPPFHARRTVPEPGGEPCLPQVRRLDDVVVDAHDLGQLHHRRWYGPVRVGGISAQSSSGMPLMASPPFTAKVWPVT